MADPILPMYKADVHDSGELPLPDPTWTTDEQKMFDTIFSGFSFGAPQTGNAGNPQADFCGFPQELSPEPSPDSGYSSASPLSNPTTFEFYPPSQPPQTFSFNGLELDPTQLQMDPNSFASFCNTLKETFDPALMENMDLMNDFGLVDPMMETFDDEHGHDAKKKRRASTMEGDGSKPTIAAPFRKLNKDELAKLSSAELEEYTKALQESNSVTTEELRELKKQRRLTKNREYAHFSRAKKKEYVGDLETKVKELTEQTNLLNAKVAALSVENKGLKAKVIHLQKMVKQSTVLSTLLTNMTSIKQAPTPKPEPSHNFQGAVGVCVLIFLFSFGLFFNATTARIPFSAYFPEHISEALPQEDWVGEAAPPRLPTRVLLEFSVDDTGIKISVGDDGGAQTVVVTIKDKFGNTATTYEKAVNGTEKTASSSGDSGAYADQQGLGVKFSNETLKQAKEEAGMVEEGDPNDCHKTHSCPKEEL